MATPLYMAARRIEGCYAATTQRCAKGSTVASHIPGTNAELETLPASGEDQAQMCRRRGGGTPAARNRQPSSGSAHCCGPSQ